MVKNICDSTFCMDTFYNLYDMINYEKREKNESRDYWKIYF